MGAIGLTRALLSPKPIVLPAKAYPTMGTERARIQIVVFEDFLCHTCRYFSAEVFPAIESTYVAPQIAQYTLVPIALNARSKEVASAALSVFNQAPQSFFAFAQAVFEHPSQHSLDLDGLVALAGRFHGVDPAVLERDVKTGLFDAELDRNFKFARNAMKKNLRTPAVFINGFLMPGISFESISVRIDELLKMGTGT